MSLQSVIYSPENGLMICMALGKYPIALKECVTYLSAEGQQYQTLWPASHPLTVNTYELADAL